MKPAHRVAVPKLRRADAAEEALRKLIAEGTFNEMPGVRFLAEALGVGVPTVTEALLRVHAVDYGYDKRNRAPWDAVLSTERPQALIIARGTPWMADWSRGCGVPTFFFSGDPGAAAVPVVGYDGGHVMRETLRQLIRLGHRSLALPVLARSPAFSKRIRRVVDEVVAETGVKVSLHTPAAAPFEPVGLRTCLQRLWMRQPPTALILVSRYEYLAAYGFVTQRGLRVPEDVSLVSLVDDEMAPWISPEPARFEHDAHQLAVVLAGWVRKPPVTAAAAPNVMLRGHWWAGASLGPPPGADGTAKPA